MPTASQQPGAPPSSKPAASTTCLPTRIVGLSDVHRVLEHGSEDSACVRGGAPLRTPTPCRRRRRAAPLPRTSGAGSRGRQAEQAQPQHTLLPLPDSPTMPTTSPGMDVDRTRPRTGMEVATPHAGTHHVRDLAPTTTASLAASPCWSCRWRARARRIRPAFRGDHVSSLLQILESDRVGGRQLVLRSR